MTSAAETKGGVRMAIGTISITEEEGKGVVDICDSEERLEEAAATPPQFFA